MYNLNSPDARNGRRGEQIVIAWLKREGWWILDIAAAGSHARFQGPLGQIIALDLLYFKSHPGIRRFAEVKWKNGAARFQKLQRPSHGFDLPKWQHYLRAQEITGISGDIAII